MCVGGGMSTHRLDCLSVFVCLSVSQCLPLCVWLSVKPFLPFAVCLCLSVSVSASVPGSVLGSFCLSSFVSVSRFVFSAVCLDVITCGLQDVEMQLLCLTLCLSTRS